MLKSISVLAVVTKQITKCRKLYYCAEIKLFLSETVSNSRAVTFAWIRRVTTNKQQI